MKKVTVLQQLFWFTFRKKISMDSMIFSAMISDNYSKKNPQWALGPTGDFFLTPHYQRTLCASFCANKNFAAVLVAVLALQMG